MKEESTMSRQSICIYDLKYSRTIGFNALSCCSSKECKGSYLYVYTYMYIHIRIAASATLFVADRLLSSNSGVRARGRERNSIRPRAKIANGRGISSVLIFPRAYTSAFPTSGWNSLLECGAKPRGIIALSFRFFFFQNRAARASGVKWRGSISAKIELKINILF